MNRVILMGRLTGEPDVRYTGPPANPVVVAKYTLAVERKYKKDGEPTADFISCTAFGRQAEFAERYLHQGIKILVEGRIQTGSYINREGRKIYTTEVIVDASEFAEKKQNSNADGQNQAVSDETSDSGVNEFISVQDDADEGLPFI